jgi:hypothetical protein
MAYLYPLEVVWVVFRVYWPANPSASWWSSCGQWRLFVIRLLFLLVLRKQLLCVFLSLIFCVVCPVKMSSNLFRVWSVVSSVDIHSFQRELIHPRGSLSSCAGRWCERRLWLMLQESVLCHVQNKRAGDFLILCLRTSMSKDWNGRHKDS